MQYSDAEEKYLGSVILRKPEEGKITFNARPARVYSVCDLEVDPQGVILLCNNYLVDDPEITPIPPCNVKDKLADSHDQFNYEEWARALGYDLYLIKTRYDVFRQFLDVAILLEEFSEDPSLDAKRNTEKFDELADEVCVLRDYSQEVYAYLNA